MTILLKHYSSVNANMQCMWFVCDCFCEFEPPSGNIVLKLHVKTVNTYLPVILFVTFQGNKLCYSSFGSNTEPNIERLKDYMLSETHSHAWRLVLSFSLLLNDVKQVW